MASAISFSKGTSTTSREHSIYSTPPSKQKMSITQTYFLAHSARSKLSREAARSDHDLRLLVGHANMLDNLMISLANAEQEQERWFNKSLADSREQAETTHEESTVEESGAEYEVANAEDSDSDYDEEDFVEIEDEQNESLALTRTVSRHSPPGLTHEGDSDSDDENMPPSPPDLPYEYLAKPGQSLFPTKAVIGTGSLQSDLFNLQSSQIPTVIAAF